MDYDGLVADRIRKCQTLDDLTFVLAILLQQNSVWEDGTLLVIRQLVSYVSGLRIEIFPNEHPPPHFHVTAADIDATFSVQECSLLNGTIGGRQKDLVQWWYKHARPKLIQIWNDTRPTDCPVGPIAE